MSGDAYVVLRTENVLLAMADGLGHGPTAREAALAFCEFVSLHADWPLDAILRASSQAMAHTRGAAAGLLRIGLGTGRASFAAVGNVELRTASARPFHPVSTPGIVGRPFRNVVVFEYEMSPGDTLVLHTDGISSRMDPSLLAGLDEQDAADAVLREHGKDHDDATCVVVRALQGAGKDSGAGERESAAASHALQARGEPGTSAHLGAAGIAWQAHRWNRA